ncbi:ankyrin repeat domain-containing protein 50 [Microdochium nivale]|nr:ankyrin repeat domain-containing protein 50 [Microdochium nivale]
MSGLEPLAALSLACNILQIVGTGRETIRVVRQIYQDEDLDPTLTERAGELGSLSKRTREVCSPAGSAGKPKARDKQLFDLAEKCQTAARDLQEEVNFLNGVSSGGKLAATLKIAAKTTWRKKRLERLDQKLAEAERALQIGLMATIFERSIKTETDLSSLSTEVRAFVNEYRDDGPKAFEGVQKHISTEVQQSEVTVTKHVDTVAARLDSFADRRLETVIQSVAGHRDEAELTASRERLLRSLKFDGMNERRNHVAESHPRTFTWVLNGENEDVYEETEKDSNGSEACSSIGDSSYNGSEGARSTAAEAEIAVGNEVACGPPWDSFTDWLRSTEPVYWICGKPGSGKSTLMRYLVGEARTRRYLNEWAPGNVLVSHFLWRPGTALQQSVKGLLLSLLHQLFLFDDAGVASALRSVQHLSQKDSDTDWSEGELRQVLDEVMRQCRCPIAMFIDGLDEVLPRDGVPKLMGFLGRLEDIAISTGKLKLCLASRPEPLLSRALAHHSHLRLEQLNRADLARYAKDNISIPSHYQIVVTRPMYYGTYFFDQKTPPSTEVLTAWLSETLVEKAEGIFLWLCLTVNSVVEALQLGESVEDLNHRIEDMPQDLANLFEDMWARINGDSPNHKARAALYLRLVMDVTPNSVNHEHLVYISDAAFFTRFNTMLATNPLLLENLLGEASPTEVSVETLFRACQRSIEDVLARCAGLVHCLGDDFARPPDPWYGEEYRSLDHFVEEGPAYKFVHRTARDFLCDTEAGQAILGMNTSSPEETRLAFSKASLATCRLFYQTRFIHFIGVRTTFDCHPQSYLSTQLHGLQSHKTLAGDSNGGIPILRHMVQLCEKLFKTGHLLGTPNIQKQAMAYRDNANGMLLLADEMAVQTEDAFLLEAAFSARSPMTVFEYIMMLLPDRRVTSATRSRLLIHACSVRLAFTSKPDRGTEKSKICREILTKGAWASASLSVRHYVTGGTGTPVWISKTPMSALLTSIWADATNRPFKLEQDDYSWLPELVDSLIDHGADLEQQIPVVMHYNGGHIWFKTLFCDAYNNELYPKNHICFIMGYPARGILATIRHGSLPRTLSLFQEAPPIQSDVLDVYDQGRLLAVAQYNHQNRGDDSYWLLAKSEIYLQEHWHPGSDEALTRFTQLAADALRESTWKLPGHIPFFISHSVSVPADVQTGLDEALQAMRACGVSTEDRARQARLMFGVETRLEDFEWRNCSHNGRPFTEKEMAEGRLEPDLGLPIEDPEWES